MSRPIVQLLQGMIHDSERSLHQIQDVVQSLGTKSNLRHTLRNLQHSELLRIELLRSVMAQLTEPGA